MESLSPLVIAAQQGDLDAFGSIVARFQDMAYASAYAMVDDAQLAEDVTQEAFIEAYLNLPNLREPAAFPGWFRRIIFKQGDRLTRGKHIVTVPLETKKLSEEEAQVVKRAQRIQLFLTQPFFVAEAYTDIPGEYVTVEDTVKDFKELLEGRYDDVPVEAFRQVGRSSRRLPGEECSHQKGTRPFNITLAHTSWEYYDR